MKTTVIRSSRRTISIELKSPEELIIRAPFRMSRRAIDKFLKEKEGWIISHAARLKEREKRAASVAETITKEELLLLKMQAKQVLPEKVAFYASKIGVAYGQISIRAQKTRFGSCSAKGNLNFNCLLMKMPPEIVDYVVVHELCHRKQMNHSALFWKEVEKVMPDYRIRRKWLKENGGIYIRAMAE